MLILVDKDISNSHLKWLLENGFPNIIIVRDILEVILIGEAVNESKKDIKRDSGQYKTGQNTKNYTFFDFGDIR